MKLEGTIKTIPLSQIILGKRLRPLDTEAVKSLAESIAQVGLLQPLVVAKTEDADEFTLIAGRHRYAAVKKLGGEEVKVTVRTVANRDEALILEIDENLQRHELSPAEEASQLKLRSDLWTKLAAASGKKLTGKGKTEAKMSTRELAKKTGKSKDTIARGLKRAKELAEDLDDVTGTSLDKGEEMDALIKVKKGDKAKAKALVADAKSGKKVSAKKAVKEVERETAKAKGAKGEQDYIAKETKAMVRDIGAAFQRHKSVRGKVADAFRAAFADLCDEHGL